MDARDTLREAIRRGGPAGLALAALPAEPCFDYAAWRLLHAWGGSLQVGPDLAVLLRQAARWHGGTLVLPPLPAPWRPWLPRAGLHQEEHGELVAEPYADDWMADEPAPDGIDAPPRRARLDERTPAEAHLAALGYRCWHSPAQKEAAWRVLTAPPGSTSLVVLPTGTGKSLLFQLLARSSRGLTVVVVPTVALAIDQCRAATPILSDLAPAYFAAGDEAESTLAAVERRQCRLVFTSPEACVSGRLRALLGKAVSEGWLDNLVIDEVHVVDSWGAYFRVDFQLLSGLRREWVEADGLLRTLLLTATLTGAARADLRTLFAPAHGRPWIELVSQRLRPEMAYYQRHFGGDEARRDEAVLKAVWRLPRPAILYVTERDDARQWQANLSDLGFQRIGCFHGDTSPRQRRDLLAMWRADEIDLMVATSAFGLGVDKQDVRAVVHACFPEDMNRYYQEVGRGGRDGWSAPCLLLPTSRDRDVASGLGPRFMTSGLLQQRWRAMWETARPTDHGDSVWQLDTSAVREGMLGRRTGEENVRWNKRLLLQLHRAGLLRLRGLRYERLDEEERGREWLEVELRFSPDSPRVGEMVEGSRHEDLEEADRGLEMVGKYLLGSECVAWTLRRLYGDGTQRVCGGCRRCRLDGIDRSECPPLEWDGDSEEEARPVLLAECPADAAGLRRLLRSFLEAGVFRFVAGPARAEVVRAALEASWPTLRIDLRRAYRVDSGPVRLLPGEAAAVLHFGELDEAGLHGGGRRVHCFAPPLTAQQLRYGLEARGATVSLFTSAGQWRQSEEGGRVHA